MSLLIRDLRVSMGFFVIFRNLRGSDKMWSSLFLYLDLSIMTKILALSARRTMISGWCLRFFAMVDRSLLMMVLLVKSRHSLNGGRQGRVPEPTNFEKSEPG